MEKGILIAVEHDLTSKLIKSIVEVDIGLTAYLSDCNPKNIKLEVDNPKVGAVVLSNDFKIK